MFRRLAFKRLSESIVIIYTLINFFLIHRKSGCENHRQGQAGFQNTEDGVAGNQHNGLLVSSKSD